MSNQVPDLPGTILWLAPFYNRSGFGVGARAAVSAMHKAGVRIRILPVDQAEPGIDDCDLALIKSLETTPLVPPITAVFSHVPNKVLLDIKLPEPNLRIMDTTVFDCGTKGSTPPTEMLEVCRKMDQIFLQSEIEREAFIAAGFSPEKVRYVPWPHPWLENPLVLEPTAYTLDQNKPFRFLCISLFVPRRRWDTLIEAYLEEFKDNKNVELYLKVSYPSWHPVPGKPREDLRQLIRSLRLKTVSQANIIIDEDLGKRTDIVKLIDSCDVYVSTDTMGTAPVGEARVRQRLVILPEGLHNVPIEHYVSIPVNPDAKRPLTPDDLLYQPNHKDVLYMPLLSVNDVRHAMRRAYDMPSDERRAKGINASIGFLCPTSSVPIMTSAINAGWQQKGVTNHSDLNKVLYIMRYAGMGDVLMSLPLARALKHVDPQQKVVFLTSRKYEMLVRANPYVDDVIPLDNFIAPGNNHRKMLLDLNPAKYGLGNIHQIDAFLNEFGITVPDSFKEIVLNIPDAAMDKVEKLLDTLLKGRRKKIVLLHAAKNDKNRTWPVKQWNRLAQMIVAEGHIVIATGDNARDPQRGTGRITASGVTDWVDQLNPFEFVALCRKADLLITTDSGTVQLAGATNIAIAGIYTVIPGKCRLPYRHGQPMWNSVAIEPECEYSGCYRWMGDERHLAPIRKKVEEGKLTIGQFFSDWCLVPERYACLHRQITPKRVWEESKKLLVKDGLFFNGPEESLFNNEKLDDAKNEFERAEEFHHKEDLAKAFNILIQAINNSQSRRLYYTFSEILIDAKRYDEALNLLSNLPDDTDARKLSLIGYCKEGLGFLDEALEYAQKALSFNPVYASALNLCGILAHNLGQVAEAERLFKMAIDSNPEYGEPYTNLGVMKWNAGDKTQAMPLLEKGFMLSPHVSDIASAYHHAVLENRQLNEATGSYISVNK